MKTVWNRLSAVMQSKGIGKADLAQIAGVGASAVTKWAAGGAIRPATLKRVADHFGVSVDWLLGGPAEITLGTPPVVRDSSGIYPPASSPLRASAPLRENAPTCRIPEGCDIVERLDRLEAEIHTLTRLLGAALALAPPKETEKKAG